jgi:hypothetical protein
MRNHLLFLPRRVELERRLQTDTMLSDERKQRQLVQHGKKESTFLRLRRTKLGLENFRTVKVIGKGAFGEVSYTQIIHYLAILNHIIRFDWFKRPTLAKSTR